MIAMRAARGARPIKQESEERGRGLAAEERRERRDEGGIAPRNGTLAAGNDRRGSRLEARGGAERGAGEADLAELLVQHLEGGPIGYGADARYPLLPARLKMLGRVKQRRPRRGQPRAR